MNKLIPEDSSKEIAQIKQWILHLMQKNNLPSNLVDPDFLLEDGMDLKTYWKYEKDNFQNLSSIYDLTTDFDIKILYKYPLENMVINNSIIDINPHQNRYFYFIYIINSLDKIVCKMNITLKKSDEEWYISGNNYEAQIVPKFGIWDGMIKEVGLAIKTSSPLIKIVSPDLEFIHLSPGNNFEEDGFYSARFLILKSIENKAVTFYLYMKNSDTVIREKRKVYFDKFQIELKPYELIHERLCVIDSSYPVHLAAMGSKGAFNKAYPRHVHVNINDYNEAIVTDCLDNDWHVNLEFIRNA